MEIKKFGVLPDGTEVLSYTMKTAEAEVRILNFGGIIADFIYKGRSIVCGFDTLEDYLADSSYQGAIIGRYANRIGGATFTLNGKTYHIGANEGKNSLHGGIVGYNRRVFNVESAEDNTIRLALHSPDGEEGFPGNLSLFVTYSLVGASLSIRYVATTDADTPVTLTNHAYFNPAGLGIPVLNFDATILADRYTAVDDELIPTGERPSVEGTEYDLRMPRKIGNKVGGYDTNFILAEPSTDGTPKLAATVSSEDLSLLVYTTQPCIQFYTGCVLEGEPSFRGGIKKARYTAFCLETQDEPDAPNYGGAILHAGEIYDHTTIYTVTERA